jgi:hypothetical protein
MCKCAVRPNPDEPKKDGAVETSVTGEVRFDIGFSKDAVVLDFGVPISHIVLPPVKAVEIARAIINAAWGAQGAVEVKEEVGRHDAP